jgi:NAD(P)-dependent dehydrogenase (short-subunit alcohol dehydrogenase family)
MTGVIIGVTNLMCVVDFPFVSAYSVSKAAIAKFHQGLALEVERYGILSFAVHPGPVHTHIYRVEGAVNPTIMEEDGAKELLEGYEQLEPQSARFMGDVCVALCSDSRCKGVEWAVH